MEGASAAGAEQLARLAQHLGAKLERLAEDTDPGRLRMMHGAAAAAATPRQALMRLFLAHIGGLPALASLLNPAARLALLPREDIHGRLCTLALACRPGVLRCCVDRATRQALQRTLGPAWDPLCALSRQGGTASEEQAARSPLQWACVGYADWRAGLVPGETVLHRLVGLSLPDAALAAVPEPPQLPPPQALQQLADTGLAWPC